MPSSPLHLLSRLHSFFQHRKWVRQRNNLCQSIRKRFQAPTPTILSCNGIGGILIGRLPIYCQLYTYILLAYEAKILFPRNNRSLVMAAIIVLYSIFFTYQTYGRFHYHSDITGYIF